MPRGALCGSLREVAACELAPAVMKPLLRGDAAARDPYRSIPASLVAEIDWLQTLAVSRMLVDNDYSKEPPRTCLAQLHS